MKTLDHEHFDVYEIRRSLDRLLNYVHKIGFYGYNNFHTTGRLTLKLCSICCQPFLNFPFPQDVFLSFLPFDIRPFVVIPQQGGSGRMAKFASSYITLNKIEPEGAWLNRALECLNWLKEHQLKGYSGFAWGYEFPLQTPGLYAPYEMPNLVVSVQCGEAFMDMYEATSEKKFLEIARSVAEFILNDIPVLAETDELLCLGYVPGNFDLSGIDVNARASSILARIGVATDERELLIKAKKLMCYVESKKTDSHAWYINDPPDHNTPRTACILDAVTVYTNYSDDKSFLSSYHKGVKFYRDNLFLETGAPKWMYDKTYPYDITNAADGIVTFSQAGVFDREYLNFAFKVAECAISQMQSSDGSFYYQMTKHYKKRFAFTGWCNSIMAYALTHLIYSAMRLGT